jgi:hypothetical protein
MVAAAQGGSKGRLATRVRGAWRAHADGPCPEAGQSLTAPRCTALRPRPEERAAVVPADIELIPTDPYDGYQGPECDGGRWPGDGAVQRGLLVWRGWQ